MSTKWWDTDSGLSVGERVHDAIREQREVRPDDGPRVEHPDGPCRYALHGCRRCEEAMAAAGARAAERSLAAALLESGS